MTTQQAEARSDAPRRVHLIFKTHLDVGFTDLARHVVARYFTDYIPRSIELASTLREQGAPERFTWTTGSWLIYEYLEAATPAERTRMEQAIVAGDIAWHALPFTTHTELMDADLFRFGLSLARELDRRYGRSTIAAKMTDVPGHTRAIVPLLAEAGVHFLHIGVNEASTPPAVPPVFVWRDPSGAEVIVMYHHAYGAVTSVPGLDEAIAFAHTGDNLGPQSPEQIRTAFDAVRREFPGAEVVASTLDAFARRLITVQDRLPVVTGEIGDTWLHGVASDPGKVAAFRTLLRLRREWLAKGRVEPEDKALKAFSRKLLVVPEHTWGLDVKTHLADYTYYAPDDLATARGWDNFQKLEASWAEQRAYLSEAVEALEGTSLGYQAAQALAEIVPTRPNLAEWEPAADLDAPVETQFRSLALDETGAVVRLVDRVTRQEWASRQNPLGLFRYVSYSQADYDRFYRQYIKNQRRTRPWAMPDFCKPGIIATGVTHGEWLPRLAGLYRRPTEEGARLLLDLAMPEEGIQYGSPRRAFIELWLPEGKPALYWTLQWFDKSATRLPEALWFSFAPHVRTPQQWKLDKMGQLISPLEVAPDGNRHLHAVGSGMIYDDGRDHLEIETLDAPLVAPGQRSLLDFNNRQPVLREGLHVLLYDNVWGTNFRMWYDEDARFRFRLSW